jgi:hypothetical protein
MNGEKTRVKSTPMLHPRTPSPDVQISRLMPAAKTVIKGQRFFQAE